MFIFEIVIISSGCLALCYKLITRNRKHKFTVCLVMEDDTHIPWITRGYLSEEEIEYDQEQVSEIALHPEKNYFLRVEGVKAFAFKDENNEIDHMVMLSKG